MGMVTLRSVSRKGCGDTEAFPCNPWHFGGGASSAACATCPHWLRPCSEHLQQPVWPALTGSVPAATSLPSSLLLAITSSHSPGTGKSTPRTCMGFLFSKPFHFLHLISHNHPMKLAGQIQSMLDLSAEPKASNFSACLLSLLTFNQEG